MGKDIRAFSSAMYKTLGDHRNKIAESLKEADDGENYEWKLRTLSTDLDHLRKYTGLCFEMIDRIPDSKKFVSALRKRLMPLHNIIAIVKPQEDCIIQAKQIIRELNNILTN